MGTGISHAKSQSKHTVEYLILHMIDKYVNLSPNSASALGVQAPAAQERHTGTVAALVTTTRRRLSRGVRRRQSCKARPGGVEETMRGS